MSEKDSATNNSGLTWKLWLVIISLTTIFTLLFWLIFFQFISAPSFLKYTGLADSVTLTNPHQVMDSDTLNTMGQLVKNGTLMSLDDLWSFQSSFYQTIVTFLIAINGLIGALAFVFIKHSSNDKAQEAAIGYSKTYIASADFKEQVNKEVQERISGVRAEYKSSYEELIIAKDVIAIQNEEIDRLTREQQEIRRHICTISKSIAESDTSDEDGFDLILKFNRS